MGRWISTIVLMAALAPLWGCAHGPSRFEKITAAAPFTRARAVGLSGQKPDSQALPALLGRLDDTDPVVRLAAHEELRKRTGQDFGYLPWASPEERSVAVGRWRTFIAQAPSGNRITPSPQLAATETRRRKVRRIKASTWTEP